ncbi:MAG: glycosyltransferase [Clostridium sp.]
MNILILSASTGGGHMKATETLKDYIESNDKNAKVKLVDTLEYINPLINKIISNGYVFLVRNMNYLYRIFYNDTDRKSLVSLFVTKALMRLSKKIIPLIKNFNADIVVTVHPFSTEIISILKETSVIQIPHICLMTDYAAHNTWIKKNVDSYCVACEDMINEMVIRGVRPDIIHPFGIPVAKEFFEQSEEAKQAFREGLQLNSVKTILIMAGSFGVNNIEDIYNSLLTIKEEFQIIIITGNNNRLYDRIRSIRQNTKKTEVVKYTRDVAKYMNLADVLITKPGGLTISEALAANLPMIIFDAIPGQEESNAKFLIKHGMAVSIGKGYNCNIVVEELLRDKSRMNKLEENCYKFNKEKSCKEIFELIKKLISENKKQNETA